MRPYPSPLIYRPLMVTRGEALHLKDAGVRSEGPAPLQDL